VIVILAMAFKHLTPAGRNAPVIPYTIQVRVSITSTWDNNGHHLSSAPVAIPVYPTSNIPTARGLQSGHF